MLSLDPEAVTFEWSTVCDSEQVSLLGIRVVDDATSPATLEVSVAWISSAKLTGGWCLPRLVLRARRPDGFHRLPGARPGLVSLRIRRPDRRLAQCDGIGAEGVRPRRGGSVL